MRKGLLVIGVALALMGCTTTSTYAVYRHPTTGDVLACENNLGPRYSMGVLGGVMAGNAFADCKSHLEVRGYVREGSVEGEPSLREFANYAAPVPVPSR